MQFVQRISFFISLFLLTTSLFANEAQPIGEIKIATDQAWIIDVNGHKRRALVGMPFYFGEALSSGIEGGVELELDHDMILSVVGKTSVVVKHYRIEELNNVSFTNLQMERGIARFRKVDGSSFESPIYIRTPFGHVYPLGPCIEVKVVSSALYVRGDEYIIPWPAFYEQDFFTRGVSIAEDSEAHPGTLINAYLHRFMGLQDFVVPFWSLSGNCQFYVPSSHSPLTTCVTTSGEVDFNHQASIFDAQATRVGLADYDWSPEVRKHGKSSPAIRLPSTSIVKQAKNLRHRFSGLTQSQKRTALKQIFLNWSKSSYEFREEIIDRLGRSSKGDNIYSTYINNLKWVNDICLKETFRWVNGQLSVNMTSDESLSVLISNVSSYAFLNRDIFWTLLELHNTVTHDQDEKELEFKIEALREELLKSKEKLVDSNG